jgi:hypothetical protein
MLWVARFSDSNPKTATGPDQVWLQAHEFGCVKPHPFGILGSIAIVDHKVGTFPPPELLEALHKHRYSTLQFRIALIDVLEHADAPHAFRLLRPRVERLSDRRAAEQRNKLTPPHVFLSGRGLHPTTPPERLCMTANSGVLWVISGHLVTRLQTTHLRSANPEPIQPEENREYRHTR